MPTLEPKVPNPLGPEKWPSVEFAAFQVAGRILNLCAANVLHMLWPTLVAFGSCLVRKEDAAIFNQNSQSIDIPLPDAAQTMIS